MDNKNINITDLIRKYEQMRYMYKNLYFDTDEFVLLANYYKDNKNTSEAEHVVNIGLRVHPGSTELMITKANVLVTSEKYEIAFDYLSTIAADETNVDLLLVKFECLLNLERTKEANGFLEYILKGELAKDKLYSFITEVGYLYNDADRFDTAIMLLEKALKLDATNMDVLIELTYSYEMNDDIDKAIEITNAMIDLNPYSYDAWISLGRLHLYNFEYELSIEAYDFALAIKESDVEALKLKALTYNQNDNFEEELKVLNECIDASPDDESLYDSLLERYEEIDQYWYTDHHEEVLKVLEKKAERFGPKGLLVKIAHLYLYGGKTEEAQEVYERVLDEDKNTLDYYKLEGELALRNQNYASAEAAYMLAMVESPDDAEVLDMLAEINFDLDKYEKAAEYLDRLIALDTEYSAAKFRLSFIRFEIGDKQPFDDIINQLSDEELRLLFNTIRPIRSKENVDATELSREELIIRLDEAREKRFLTKNTKS